ncbi:MAG: CDP-diacylglycerol--glycerol-3-phosphate 3-phosphatidyltransferase [Planctomycetales bacterium]|nr:CDP-diacylglycerol--glycerol-3-phosphate 3-phosphatidyltransferase [Planctomycetales bacterium]
MPDVSRVATDKIWNVPNSLSFLRLLLSVFVGILIEWNYYLIALVVFVVAATTDFVDGWWARKFNQITKLGRILDPFVDKIIITAAVVGLVAIKGSCVPGWLATVIIGRELLVTTLRAMIEGQGGDFSARHLGKWKFLLQCAAVVSSLILLSQPHMATWLVPITVILWGLALLLTVASGADYVIKAIELNRNQSAHSI